MLRSTFDNDSDYSQLDFLNDIDPDDNLLNFIANDPCQRYNEQEFTQLKRDKFSNNPHLSFFHVNIRSVPKNFKSLTDCFHVLDHWFTIIALTETWHNVNTQDLFNIPGYTCLNKFRSNRRGGGVALYIAQSIDFVERLDLSIPSEDVDSIFVQLKLNSTSCNSKAVLGVVYRPPSTDPHQFTSDISNVIARGKSDDTRMFIMGDFNIDISQYGENTICNDFVDIMSSFCLLPVISLPTRITETSSTIIDNIFCNNVDNMLNVTPGILCTDLSDHLPIFCFVQGASIATCNDSFCTRSYSQGHIDAFINSVNDTDWLEIIQSDSAQTAFSNFFDIFKEKYDEYFPVKTVNRKIKRSKPWINGNLKSCINKKNKLYRKYKRIPSVYNKNTYYTYKSSLSKTLKLAEKKYYADLIAENKDNMRKTWSIIKEAIGSGRGQIKANTCTKFQDGENTIDDVPTIANKFNHTFVNLGPDLARNIDVIGVPLATTYIENYNASTIFVNPISVDEVRNVILSLKNTSAPGWDQIKPVIIKHVVNAIAPSLSVLLNNCISDGVFPDELKVARVTPIYKGGGIDIYKNYRPVSVLNSFSKIFERIIYNRLIAFFENHNVLSNYQFGFRENHSTSQALIHFVNEATGALASRQYFIGIFIDLCKAFDTVDHSILLKKLEIYGVRGQLLDLLKNYLSNRKQFVYYANTSSDTMSISCGVPQGSILGPLLFLAYINDLPKAVPSLKTIMFADDTSLFLNHSDYQTAINLINNELANLSVWLRANRLSLNTQKSKCMLFSTKPKINDTPLGIYINNTIIETVTVIKFLGVHVQNNLKWDTHIQHITGKIAKGIGIINKVKNKFEETTLIQLYYAFVYPYINYCNLVWGNAGTLHINRIIKLQKRAFRIIHQLPPRSSVSEIMKQKFFFSAMQVYYYQLLLFVFKCIKGLVPSLFSSYYYQRNSVHFHSTRYVCHLNLEHCRIELRKKFVIFSGSLHFNIFLRKVNIKFNEACELSLFSYKRKIKSFVLQNSFS